MLRILILAPCLILSFLAYQAHTESEAVTIEMVDPDQDPYFSSVAGLSWIERVRTDQDLSSEYVSALVRYDNELSSASFQRSELQTQRDNYLIFMFVFSALFAASFLPWARWIRSATTDVATSAGRASAVGTHKVSKLKRNDRTIIKRDGLGRYSVSTELKNWKELLDSGAVTEEEFKKAKSKILGN